MMNRFIFASFFTITIMTLAFWVWRNDIASDREYKLEVLAPITLLKYAPQDYPKTNIEVGHIISGETVEVLRMGYGKDFRAWFVKGSKSQEGWFVEDGKNVRASKKSDQKAPNT